MSINRNIVECKEDFSLRLADSSFVLIETQWNVKEYLRRITEGSEQVLIETQWNVKKTVVAVIGSLNKY